MKSIKKLAHVLSLILASTPAVALTDAQVFTYAEANFPSIFSGSGIAGVYQQYIYRYYPASQNYLAVDTAGEIFILGPYTKNVMTSAGPMAAYANAIAAWQANATVSATGQYRVVDTGQSSCYNSSTGAATLCAAKGHDADYSGNQPSYAASSDGKVLTDTVTGLVWTQSTDTDGNGVVNYSDKKFPADAASYCSKLTLGGYTWRLPSIKELYSLILFSGKDASSYSGSDTSTLTPFIDRKFDWAFGDTSAGERIIDAQYATSTNYVSTTMAGDATMFGVNFVDGRIKGYPYNTKKFYVRCVAGSSSYGTNDFRDNGDNTISDRATGLMWEKNDRPSLTWDAAVAACEAATTGNHSDWRLPNSKELHTIVDYTRSPATSDSAAIDPIFNATAITNEGGARDWGYYWSSTTHIDNDGKGSNATYFSFGRGLGYFATSPTAGVRIVDVHGAGSQRSDNKVSAATVAGGFTANAGFGTFYYHGPQGDILRSANMARCVR